MIRKTGVAIAAAAAIGLVVSADTSNAAEKWSMTTSWSGGAVLEFVKKLSKQIEFITGGEVKIEVFPGGTLGSPLKVSETVRNGVAEMGHHWVGYDWGVDKTTVLFGGWTGGLNAEQSMHWIYEGGGLKTWQDYRMEKFGVVAFPCGVYPREVGLHSTKKVQSLADFKGLKQRTAGAWAEISKGLGVSAVILPGAEVYPALERGVIDAVEWGTLSVNKTSGFHKIAKYIIMPGYHHPVTVLECVVNKEAWGRLSERTQKLVMAAAYMETNRLYLETGHNDAEAFKFYAKSGNEMVVVDDAVLTKVRKLAAAWGTQIAEKQGGWFKKVLAIQRDYQELWSNAHKYRDSAAPK